MARENDFVKPVITALAKRASYICSNPDCRSLTIAPSEEDGTKSIFIGEAAHMSAASANGARYDPNLTDDQRSDISNGIFLCANCATMIDKNEGMDFPIELLKEWKAQHEQWIAGNLNKSIVNSVFEVNGDHHASGVGKVTALELNKPTIIKSGTISKAEGIGDITATKIG